MDDPRLIYILILLVGILINSVLVYRSRQQQWSTGAAVFTLLLLAQIIWSSFYIIELWSNDPATIITAHKLKHIGVVLAPPLWYLFSIHHTKQLLQWRDRRIVLIFAVPLLILVLQWTHELHPFFYAAPATTTNVAGYLALDLAHGTGYYLMLAYSYLAVIGGVYRLVVTSAQSIELPNNQALLVMGAVGVIGLANILSLANTSSFSYVGVDAVPMLLPLINLLVTWVVLTRRTLLTLNPISYNQVLEKLPDAVLVLDDHLKIIASTPSVRRLLSKESNALVGTPIQQFHPKLEPIILQSDGTLPPQDELILNGRYVQVIAASMNTAQDNVQGYVVTLRDQTVRRQTETAMYAYERRYRALFENSNDAIFIIDLDLTVIIANDQAATILGADLARMLHREILPSICKDDHEKFHSAIQKLIAGKRLPLIETILMHKQGHEIPTECILTLVRDAKGEPLHIQMIMRDITERKRAEAAMTRQLEQLALLRGVDTDINRTLDIGMVLKVGLNAAANLSEADAGFIALTEGEIVTLHEVHGYTDEHYIGYVLTYADGISGRVLATHEPELIKDVHNDPDYRANHESTVALMAVPLVVQDRFVGLLELETDEASRFNQEIFEFIQLLANRLAIAIENARLYDYTRHQLNELQRIYEELQQAEAMKSDMLHLANHDLKNPLSILSGYLSVFEIDHQVMDTNHVEYLDAMRKSVKRMHHILDDFLSFDKFDQRIKTTTPIDLCNLVHKALDEYEPQAVAKYQALVPVFPQIASVIVQGDEPQLYEAITNLVGNAIKYTPDAGYIEVIITLLEHAVIFKVVDNGYGVPDEQQARLFEAFFRPVSEETEDIDGTGLGLYLVKRIVDRHNGEIIFESVYGEGSTFGFQLPLPDDEIR